MTATTPTDDEIGLAATIPGPLLDDEDDDGSRQCLKLTPTLLGLHPYVLIELDQIDPEGAGVHIQVEPGGGITTAEEVRFVVDLLDHKLAVEAGHGPTDLVLRQVGEERARQDTRWGQQDHPDGNDRPHERGIRVFPSGPAKDQAQAAKWACQRAAADGSVTWRDILLEEVMEALAEEDPRRLRAELIQVAAVAACWAEAIDRRTVQTAADLAEPAPAKAGA